MNKKEQNTQDGIHLISVQEMAIKYKRAMLDQYSGDAEVEELKKSMRDKLTEEEINLIGTLMMAAFTEGGIYCAKDPKNRVPAFLNFWDDFREGKV